MSVVRLTDGLLPASGVVSILQLLQERPFRACELEAMVTAKGLGSAVRARNTTAVLGVMGLLTHNSGQVQLLVGQPADGDWHAVIRKTLLALYCGLIRQRSLGPLFQFSDGPYSLLADRVLLPGREFGLPYLLLEFGILHRATGRALPVAADAAPKILTILEEANAGAAPASKMSPAELEAWLAARQAAGQIAEAFALAFERDRLSSHLMREQIRWVAQEDVTWGFDILSFDDDRSLLHDRRVEVKGYAGERQFHWSVEEIAAARKWRGQYWLYLVDRSRIHEPGYRPEMISDPFTFFVEENPSGWTREATSYLFKAPIEAAVKLHAAT